MRAMAACALLAVGCSTVTFLPQKPMALDRASPPAAVDSAATPIASTMPSAGTAAPPRIPVATEARLRNGVRVLMLEEHSFPVVALGVTLARGSVDAAPGVFGVFVDSMAHGSDLISPKALRRTLYEYAARETVEVEREASHIEVHFLSVVLRDVVRMAVTPVARPSFDSDDFNALLDEHRRKAARLRDSPGATAERELYKLLYPSGHPYTQDVADAAKPLADVTLDAVRNMRAFVGADDVSVVAAGDFMPEKLLPLLEEALGTLHAGAKAPQVVAASPPPTAAHVVAIDHPGDTQARIALGFMGVKYDDPDYAALFSLSRIIQERARAALRSGHGLTYSVSGNIAMMRAPAPVAFTAAVSASGVAQALEDTFGALKSVEDRLRDPAEFQHIKNWILASWPDTFDTVSDSIHKLETLAQLDLPVGTWVKLRDAVQNLNADDLSRAAKKYLDPSRAQLVVLGDVSRFKVDLDALGIAEVEVRKAH